MGLWHRTPWHPRLDWNTGGGRLLRRALAVLDRGQPFSVTVVGFCPLEMGVDADLANDEVDIIGDLETTWALEAARLLKGQADPWVAVWDPSAFLCAPDWRDRAFAVREGSGTLVLPHPVDILVSKVPRLDGKDIAAFEVVRRRLGHPTEGELLESLKLAVDIYRPAFEEEAGQDPDGNTRALWRRAFGREIDVREEIIRPALRRRQVAWGLAEETKWAANCLPKIADRAAGEDGRADSPAPDTQGR